MPSRILVATQVSKITGQVSGLASPAKIVLTPQSTQGVQVTGLQDAISGAYINVTTSPFTGAQFTVSLIDQWGNTVNECNEVPLSYVNGTNGNYMAVFGDENFTPAGGSGYTLVIDGNDGAGDSFHMELVAEVVARKYSGASGATGTNTPVTPATGNITLYALSPAPNGSTNTFTTTVAISSSAIVSRNGLILANGYDYSVSGASITFFVTPQTGDNLALWQ